VSSQNATSVVTGASAKYGWPMASRFATEGPRRYASRAQIALAVLGIWSVLPPYLGPFLGLELNVAADVEVVDHVVSGVVVAVCAGVAALLVRRGAAEDSATVLALTGTCFLAGLWQVATHVPLVLDGGASETPWDSVLLHSSPGPVIAVIALWLTLRAPAAHSAEAG